MSVSHYLYVLGPKDGKHIDIPQCEPEIKMPVMPGPAELAAMMMGADHAADYVDELKVIRLQHIVFPSGTHYYMDVELLRRFRK